MWFESRRYNETVSPARAARWFLSASPIAACDTKLGEAGMINKTQARHARPIGS